MHITKQQLRQLIKEELEAFLKEEAPRQPWGAGQPGASFKKGSIGYGAHPEPGWAAEGEFKLAGRRNKRRHEACWWKCSTTRAAEVDLAANVLRRYAPKACLDFCRRLPKKDFKSFRGDTSYKPWGGHGTDTVFWKPKPGDFDADKRIYFKDVPKPKPGSGEPLAGESRPGNLRRAVFGDLRKHFGL